MRIESKNLISCLHDLHSLSFMIRGGEKLDQKYIQRMLPLDPGHKLNVHKTLIKHPRRLVNVRELLVKPPDTDIT